MRSNIRQMRRRRRRLKRIRKLKARLAEAKDPQLRQLLIEQIKRRSVNWEVDLPEGS